MKLLYKYLLLVFCASLFFFAYHSSGNQEKAWEMTEICEEWKNENDLYCYTVVFSAEDQKIIPLVFYYMTEKIKGIETVEEMNAFELEDIEDSFFAFFGSWDFYLTDDIVKSKI